MWYPESLGSLFGMNFFNLVDLSHEYPFGLFNIEVLFEVDVSLNMMLLSIKRFVGFGTTN